MIKGTEKERMLYMAVFAAITALFLITRLFRLDMAPFTAEGMHFDEMSAAYDAFCIQGWGVDRHLTRFPVYFMNTGPGQNALYIYLAAVVFKLFGFSLFKFRMVAVVCAFAAYICLYFLSGKLFGNGPVSLIPNALMTVMPVFLMSEHWGLESYLFLSFSIISFYFLVLAVEKERTGYFVLDGILWGITFYTYGVSYVVIPLFGILTLGYLLYMKKIRIRDILGLGVPMVLLGLPLALEQLVIAEVIRPFSTGFMDFLPMDRSRVKDVSFSYIPENLRTSFVTLFSKDYLFYNSVPKFGTIFYISIPFMIAGLVLMLIKAYGSLKNREYEASVLILCFYIAGRLMSLMSEGLNINKANELYFPYLIFTAAGIVFILEKINRKWPVIVIAAGYGISFLFFAKWAYSNGEDSWNYQSRPRTTEYIVEDIHTGLAIEEAKKIAGDKKLQMMINDVEARYLQICLFAGTSPYDYDREGYEENGYAIGIPEELDLSGDTVYLIAGELHHITDYLVTEGFTNKVADHDGFSVVYIP